MVRETAKNNRRSKCPKLTITVIPVIKFSKHPSMIYKMSHEDLQIYNGEEIEFVSITYT